MSKVRVLRIIEYTGEHALVDEHLAHCTHGIKTWGHGTKKITMRASIVGDMAELLPPFEVVDEKDEG